MNSLIAPEKPDQNIRIEQDNNVRPKDSLDDPEVVSYMNTGTPFPFGYHLNCILLKFLQTSWLIQNFRVNSKALLAREFVFGLYKKFAQNTGKPLMNPACLGKSIRKVFPEMKTRRLGRR